MSEREELLRKARLAQAKAEAQRRLTLQAGREEYAPIYHYSFRQTFFYQA